MTLEVQGRVTPAPSHCECGVTSASRPRNTSCFFSLPVCGINASARLFLFPHRLLHAASPSEGWTMTFEEILHQAIAMLQPRGRLTYGALKRQFQLDDAYLEDLNTADVQEAKALLDELLESRG